MSRIFKLISVPLLVIVTACSAIPKREAPPAVASRELIKVYKKIIEYEDGLPQEALDPSRATPDDPRRYFGYVVGYETKNREWYDRVRKRFHQLVPDPSRVDPATAAKTRQLLDDLQRRYGISDEALLLMMRGRSRHLIREYIKSHPSYHVTRLARYYRYGGKTFPGERRSGPPP